MRRLAAIAGAVLGAGALWVAAPALSLEPYVPRVVDFGMAVPVPHSAASDGPLVTGVVHAPKRFDLVGLRWEDSAPVSVRLRVRRAGGDWSPWVDVPQADTRDVAPGRPLHGTDPVWAGGSDAFQLELSRRPRGLTAHFVNSTGTASALDRVKTTLRRAVHAAVATFAPAAARAQGSVSIVPRESWGADQCPPRVAPSYGAVDVAFVHHTVSANSYGPGDSASIVLAICRYHRNNNGWNDIGYNFVVDQYGQIFEGRAGGIDQAVIGAHAQGYNRVSTGIASLGTHSDVPVPSSELESLANLIGWKLPYHGTPVSGTATVTSGGGSVNRYPQGRKVTFQRISGHRDGDSTACPGDALYRQLPTLREMVVQRAPVTGPAGFSRRLTLQAPRATLRYPARARLTGRLSAPSGEVVGGADIHVQALRGRSIRLLARATTEADGSWTAAIAIRRNWVVRAVDVAPGNTVRTASPRVSLNVAPALSASLSTRRTRAGGRVRVSGRIAPAKSRLAVQLARQGRGGRFGRARRLALRARGGRFSRTLRLSRAGLYRVRVLFGGDRLHAQSASRSLYVRALRRSSRAGSTGGTGVG
jgi:hypothetical protein